MFNSIKNLFATKQLPMNKIRIHKDAILFNYGFLFGVRPNDAIFPVIKSNAYGHGLAEIVQILDDVNTPYLIVDSLPEFHIAKEHTDKNFLLLGETNPSNYTIVHSRRLTLTVYNLSTLTYLLQTEKSYKIHLFLNTGMNREGLDATALEECLELLKHHENKNNITVEGVLSHFADAENPDQTTIMSQINLFKKMYYTVLDYGHNIKRRHIGNSAALLGVETDFFNSWRPGLALYGYNPLPENHPQFEKGEQLKPALEIQSTIVAKQDVQAGSGVGYNATWVAKETTTICTIPFGYKEGLPRVSSNTLMFGYKNSQDEKKIDMLQQVGTISMNLCSFVDDASLCAVGDKITVISPNKSSGFSMENLAQKSQTIVYECLVRLDPMLRREIVD